MQEARDLEKWLVRSKGTLAPVSMKECGRNAVCVSQCREPRGTKQLVALSYRPIDKTLLNNQATHLVGFIVDRHLLQLRARPYETNIADRFLFEETRPPSPHHRRHDASGRVRTAIVAD